MLGSDIVDSVLTLELFKGIDARVKNMLIKEANTAFHQRGTYLTVQDQYSQRFWVILRGLVSSYRQDGGKTNRLDTLGAGQWFGEVNALSNRPSLATLKVEIDCVALELDAPLFKELYKSRRAAFRGLVDEIYRQRSLGLHLRIVHQFKDLAEQDMATLKDKVEFQDIESGKVVAKKGERQDALYLVRDGALKCVDSSSGRERILAYYPVNSSFGEAALTSEDVAWPGDIIAMSPVSLLRVEGTRFKTAFPSGSVAGNLVNKTGLMIIHRDVGAPPDPLGLERQDEFLIMVDRESAKGGEALAIRLDRCIRCNACVESCVAVHEDRVPRLSKTGPRVSDPEAIRAGTDIQITLATSCYNCEIPECMMSCGEGAIRRDARGLIRFEFDNCTGCGACVTKCPYGVISITPPPLSSQERPKYRRHWFLSTMPFIGRLFSGKRAIGKAAPAEAAGEKLKTINRERPVTAKAVKCDLCAGLPFEACVYNCPTRAIQRSRPEDVVKGRFGRD